MIWANTNVELPAPWRKHMTGDKPTVRNGAMVWQRDDVEDIGEMLNEFAALNGCKLDPIAARAADERLAAHRKQRDEAERKVARR